MELATVYFDKPGKDNTDEVLEIAKKRAQELGIKTVIVATTVGDTAAKAVGVFKAMKVVVVTHLTGMKEPNFQELTDENRKTIEKGKGIHLIGRHRIGCIRKI